MANPLVNAFTLAAFVFMLAGVMRPADFLTVLAVSVIVTHAAPALHKNH